MKTNTPSKIQPKSEILTHAASDCAEIAAAIRSIAAAARTITRGALTLNAAALLIRDLLPHGSKTRLTVRDIQDVLASAAALGEHVRTTP